MAAVKNFQDIYSALFDCRYGLHQFYDSSQSLGSDLTTNGNMSSWVTDNLQSWSVTGESGANPKVTERDANQTHANTKTVGGAANFFSTTNSQPRIAETILTVNGIYQVDTNLSARVSGNFAYNGFIAAGNNNFVTVGNTRSIKRASDISFVLLVGNQPTDLTIDSVSIKRITVNTPVLVPKNFTQDYFFNPASPSGQEEIFLQYRMPLAGSELLDGFIIYLRRRTGNTNWDMRTDKLVSGARSTNYFNIASVGATTIGLRVNINNDVHTISSWDSSYVLTERGHFTDSTYSTSRLTNIIYPSDVTDNQVIVTA